MRLILSLSFVLLLFAAFGCNIPHDDQETAIEWQKPCSNDDECDDGECLCGVCTIKCSRDSQCSKVGSSSRCLLQGTKSYRDLCQCRDEALKGICLSGCTDNEECKEGEKCVDQICLLENVIDTATSPLEKLSASNQIVDETRSACDESSYDSDGNLISHTTRIFDENEMLVSEAYEDFLGNNSIHYIRNYFYDETGKLIRQETDGDGDCEIDTLETDPFETDSDAIKKDVFGNVVAREQDFDGDGQIEYSSIKTYDDRCFPLSEERTQEFFLGSSSEDQPTEIQIKTTYYYDSSGILSSIEYDQDADGTVEARNTYDENGRLLYRERDWNDDGTFERWQPFTYDEAGNLLTREFDYDDDGVVDVICQYEYDSDNRLLSLETNDFDFNSTSKRFYSYDNQGRLSIVEEFSSPDRLEERQVYQYECAEQDMIRCSP